MKWLEQTNSSKQTTLTSCQRGGQRGVKPHCLTRCERAWPERELRSESFLLFFLFFLVSWLQDLKTHHCRYECLRGTTPKVEQNNQLRVFYLLLGYRIEKAVKTSHFVRFDPNTWLRWLKTGEIWMPKFLYFVYLAKLICWSHETEYFLLHNDMKCSCYGTVWLW